MMKHYSNAYEIKTACRIQKRLLSLSQFLHNFSLIKCLSNLVCTISRYCIKYLDETYSNFYEVKTVCHMQKRLLSLSYILSYCPSIRFFFSYYPSVP